MWARMVNCVLKTDPLAELQLVTPAVPDRLPAMLFLAALVHGVLIIGVTFNAELADRFANVIALEVTIVANPDQQIDRPDDAEYLAQTSQEGGGNTTEQVRASAPLQSAMTVDNDGMEDGTALVDADTHQQSADEVLASQDASDRQVGIEPRTDPPTEYSSALGMEAGHEATLRLPQEDPARRPMHSDAPPPFVSRALPRAPPVASLQRPGARRTRRRCPPTPTNRGNGS